MEVCDRNPGPTAGLCVPGCQCTPCPMGQTCQPDGYCVSDDCAGVTCPTGMYCRGGQCRDACETGPDTRLCPSGEVCRMGECVSAASRPDGGSVGDAAVGDGGSDGGATRDSGLPPRDIGASGDGGADDVDEGSVVLPPARRGCGCRAVGSSAPPTPRSPPSPSPSASPPRAVALAATAAGRGARAQEVEVYTMGPGADVFSRFGHAAMCVRDAESPGGRCYNYGTTDFSTPGPLTWQVLRGRARFWVSAAPLDLMLAWYAGEDRTVWRQRVRLAPDAFAALQRRLREDMRPESRAYVYHHFRDNCTTRVRDHLDAVTLGALRGPADAPHGPSWRAMVREGFASDPPLLAVSDLLLGRPLDAAPTRWEAMFLPAALRDEVARRLGAAPEVVHARRAPAPAARPSADVAAFALLAALLAALGVGRRRPLRALAGLATGALGLLVWTLSLASALPELHDNDLRAVLLPTDLALGALRGPALTLYARARVAMALAASCLHALGVTPQPVHLAALAVVAAMLPWAREPAAPPDNFSAERH
jgi:hypothetical protein